jgi:hypothetical protein
MDKNDTDEIAYFWTLMGILFLIQIIMTGLIIWASMKG